MSFFCSTVRLNINTAFIGMKNGLIRQRDSPLLLKSLFMIIITLVVGFGCWAVLSYVGLDASAKRIREVITLVL